MRNGNCLKMRVSEICVKRINQGLGLVKSFKCSGILALTSVLLTTQETLCNKILLVNVLRSRCQHVKKKHCAKKQDAVVKPAKVLKGSHLRQEIIDLSLSTGYLLLPHNVTVCGSYFSPKIIVPVAILVTQ